MSNQTRARLTIVAGVMLVAGSAILPFAAHAQLTTSTLGTAIDSVNSTWYDYFLVLLAKYWPFVVGVGILVAVWVFGRRAIHGFN